MNRMKTTMNGRETSPLKVSPSQRISPFSKGHCSIYNDKFESVRSPHKNKQNTRKIGNAVSNYCTISYKTCKHPHTKERTTPVPQGLPCSNYLFFLTTKPSPQQNKQAFQKALAHYPNSCQNSKQLTN